MIYNKVMTSIEDELLAVESTLKKCAEQLGRLNLDNNRLQEFNEELSIDIQKLQGKVAKKTHSIEQEEKDKQIIHQKLVRAEQIKEQLEIQQSKIQALNQQQQSRQHYEQERNTTMSHKQQQPSVAHTSENIKKHKDNTDLAQGKKMQQKAQQKTQQQAKTQARTLAVVQVKPTSEIKASSPKAENKQSPKTEIYQNTEKGEYEPPALFLDDNESDSDSDQDNSKVLQSLKQKLKQDKEQLDQDDD